MQTYRPRAKKNTEERGKNRCRDSEANRLDPERQNLEEIRRGEEEMGNIGKNLKG